LKMDLKRLQTEAQKAIKSAEDLKDLRDIYKKYLGKQGELTQILRSLEKMPKAKKIRVGREANRIKSFLIAEFDQRAADFKLRAEREAEEKEWIDVTAPGQKLSPGHLHPLTLAKRKTVEIFQSMGFSVVEGPDIENEWYNFDALNIPKDHPARDAWDTFYLENGLLLRTHTTPVDARFMEKNNPPLRIINLGNVFRHEATDSSHEFQLCQVDGLMIDKEISVANFKATISEFFRRFFEKDVDFRLRPDFFPFTEPSFDISITCVVCGGKGCPVCKGTGFVEVAGAGMVHPNVFKACKLIPSDWQGWAFGFGLERLVMMKHKIGDIRLFRSGDLRFLKQF